jgi:uncharacterized protein (TIGR04255 family)
VDEYRGLQATFGMIQGRGRPPVVQDLGFQGYFWKTSDEKTIVQFRVDGFTFNRLRPYTSWTELFPQALDLWHLYSRVSRPEVITRLAVRYINRIPLPAGVTDFSDLFVRYVFMRLSRPPPMKVLATQGLQSLQNASNASD